jgi:hypothetical protein
LTDWQRKRLTQLFYQLNDAEEHDIKQAAKAIKRYIVMLMHESYKLGWKDSGAKADELDTYHGRKV